MRIVTSFVLVLVAIFMARRYARSTMNGFTGVCVTIAIASITWTEVKPIAFPLSDFLLLLVSLPVLVRLVRDRNLAPLPRACLIGIMLVALAVLLNAILPVSQMYADARYSGDTDIPKFTVLSETSRIVSSLTIGVKLLVGLMIMPTAIMSVAPDRARLMTLLDLWAGSILVNAGVALLDASHLTNISAWLHGVSGLTGGRQPGLTNHPNHLATVLVMGIPIVLSWWQRDRIWRRRGAIALAVLLVALYSTGSRGGLAAGCVIIVLGVLTQPVVVKTVMPYLVPAVFVVGAILILDHSLAHALLKHTRFSSAGASGSNHQRAEVGHQAILDIKHRPLLGIGFDVADQGHSIYLQAIATGGVLTLGALVLYVSGVIRGVRVWVRDEWTPTVVATFVSLLGWLTLGIVDNDFADRYPYVPMAMMLAIAAVRMRERESADSAGIGPSLTSRSLAPAPRSARVQLTSRPASSVAGRSLVSPRLK